ncbi:hypothetical protein [Methylobacterium sp. Gmos1]
MDGYWLLLFVPPLVAVFAAWLGSRAIKRGAAQIDRDRQALRDGHPANRERETMRTPVSG